MFNGGFTDLLLLALAAILIVAAVIDVRTFTISNRLNAAVALGAPLYWLSIALTPWPGMAIQLAAGGVVFAVLAGAFYAGMMGGGDVKLLTVLAVGLPLMGIIQLLAITAFAGGVLAMVHLMMRNLPHPRLAPAGSSLLRRVYAVERWRHLRHAPLPYGVAIACGGIAAILSKGS